MNFKEQITQMREAARVPEPMPEPMPEPVSEFSDPAVALEDARDQLGDVRRELEAERERRVQAERKAEQATRPQNLQAVFRKPARFK